MAKSTAAPLKIVAFSSAEKWEKWLDRNHAKSAGIWLRFYKKGSGHATVSRTEALDAALCYGWIDSQARSGDAESYLQKFSPRRPRSLWSKINTQHALRLIKARRMQAAGLQQIAAAKADGRWRAAYDSHRTAVPPPDFLRSLAGNSKARACFVTLKKHNVYAILFRLQTARKPEIRARRMALILGMLSRGEKFHP